MSWDDTDDVRSYYNERRVTRANKILSHLPVFWLHRARVEDPIRELIERWCRFANVKYEDWPDRHEWSGLVDLAVLNRAEELELHGWTKPSSVVQACAELNIEYDNLRRRWNYNGRRPW